MENIAGAKPNAAKSDKQPEPEADPDAEAPRTRTLNDARELILKAMDSIDQDDDWYALGPLGQFVTAANPDFDTRTYGKRKLSDLVQSIKIFETKRGPGNQLLVRRID